MSSPQWAPSPSLTRANWQRRVERKHRHTKLALWLLRFPFLNTRIQVPGTSIMSVTAGVHSATTFRVCFVTFSKVVLAWRRGSSACAIRIGKVARVRSLGKWSDGHHILCVWSILDLGLPQHHRTFEFQRRIRSVSNHNAQRPRMVETKQQETKASSIAALLESLAFQSQCCLTAPSFNPRHSKAQCGL